MMRGVTGWLRVRRRQRGGRPPCLRARLAALRPRRLLRPRLLPRHRLVLLVPLLPRPRRPRAW